MDWVQRGGPWTGFKGVVHGPGVHVLYTSHADNSPLSHGGHLIMKSRLSVAQLFEIMPNRGHCCVPLCTNNRSKGGTGITFHCFPTNRKLKRTWIVKIRRDVGKTFQVSNVFSLRNYVLRYIQGFQLTKTNRHKLIKLFNNNNFI